ncbi:MAG: repeat-associated core domain protein [Candidatus Eremiobacteraeota bacterium]|nr:repeat-associated core domain protein [Candidatus Eremiobacteraeota bacterium]
MLRPNEIDYVLRAARAQARSRASQPALPKPIVLPPSTSVTISRSRPGVPVAPKTSARTTASLSGVSSGTGINPWWRYQEQNIPGGGRLMANVGTGNVLLQDDDMTVPNKGISLAFRRTYNSQSLHDVNASDAAPWYWKPAGLYGNGWTNTFDAHLVRTPDSSQLSVFDIDGTRYDFVPGGGWYSPVPGNDTTLTSDNACGVLWTKKSGTTYYFYRPNPNAPCPGFPSNGGLTGGFAGRLYQIIGRNRNTSITFSYAWDGGIASATGKISSITAQTEAGQSATLYFGDVNGHRLLQQLVYPDGVTSLWYGYDALGNLTWVSRPENNASGVRPIQTFGYQSIGSGSVLQYAASPRYDAGCRAGGCGTDGGLLTFTFTGSSVDTSALSSIWHYAVVNPVVPDGTNSGALQGASYSTTAFWYLGESYTTGVPTPTYRDTDGHMTNWVVDNAGRPTQTQQCTVSTSQGQQCTGQWLLLNESWDANNNLTAEVDARGYQTDYAYDTNGNTVAVAQPAVSVQTASGQVTTRPTKLFSYDIVNGITNNNVVAYCDEVWTQAHGRNWDQTGNPGSSDTLCPVVAGSASAPTVPTFTYQYPSYEPQGRLSQSVTATGYHKAYRYDTGPQQGNDFGLPTDVSGDGFTEVDGTTYLQAHQTFVYDAEGNVISYGPGVGTWLLAYDSLNRLTSATDPDGVVSRRYYLPDSSLSKTETAAQHAANVAGTYGFDAGVLYGYDLDGSTTSETHHHGNVVGTTSKWYDGEDRLIEVKQPGDSADVHGTTGWLTRYLYDLRAGNNVVVAGSSFHAYGGLFDTQEFISAGNASHGYGTFPPGAVWRDVRAQEFDALDRMIGKYGFSPSAATSLTRTAFNYDGGQTLLGLLGTSVDPLGQTTTYGYDAAARKTSITFKDNGNTPSRTYVYDADGRPARITSTAYGTQVTTYDADGRVVSLQEGSGGGFTSAATLGYDYYPDGRRKDLTVQSSGLTASPLLTYQYRADGRRTAQTMQLLGARYPHSWTYSNAGRPQTQGDPYTGTPVPAPTPGLPAGTTYAAKQWTYDANGDLSQLTLPVVGAYRQITHDLEGAVKSYHVHPAFANDNVIGLTANIRGESQGQTVQDPYLQPAPVVLRNSVFDSGAQIGVQPGPGGRPPATTWDPVNSVITLTKTWVTNNNPNTYCLNPDTMTETYDSAARHTVSTSVSTDDPSLCSQVQGSTTTSYDSENHATLISSNALDLTTRT